jgi:hypothetical protein
MKITIDSELLAEVYSGLRAYGGEAVTDTLKKIEAAFAKQAKLVSTCNGPGLQMKVKKVSISA